MTCPKCANEILDGSQFCPRCGHTIQAGSTKVELDFGGSAIELLGWILLSIVATLVVIPIAWVSAAMGRWMCRNMKFSDGTTATFRGTGGQIVGWFIVYSILTIGFEIGNFTLARKNLGASLLLTLGFLLVASAIILQLTRWWVSNVELSSGPPLTFEGTYGAYLGWYLLTAILVYTLIGWAWAAAGMYRWYARNTRGQGVEFQFHGKGHQILWRTLLVALASMLIIPIPWVVLWLMRWIVQNISMSRSAVAVAAASA